MTEEQKAATIQEQLLALAVGDKQRSVAELTIKMAGDKSDSVCKKAVKLVYEKNNFGWACAQALGVK